MYCPRRLVGASPSTLRQYEIQFRHFERFLSHEPTLDDLTSQSVGGLLQWLLDGGDGRGVRSPATVNKCRSHLVAIWSVAAARGVATEPPEVNRLPEPEPQPVAWRMNEIAALLLACHKMRGEIMGLPAPIYYESLLRVWLDGGERTWATMAVRMEWLDWNSGWLRIPAGARKGKSKSMDYRLKASTMASLGRMREPSRDMLFPWPWSVGLFYKRYDELLEIAGLPTGRKRKGQGMRITFATHLELHGGDATRALRHSSRSTTERSYLDRTLLTDKSPSDILPDWDGAA